MATWVSLIFILAASCQLPKEEIKRLDREYPNTLKKIKKHEPLDLSDIIYLTRTGFTDLQIIDFIEAQESLFFLTSEDERELEQAGVSKRVIETMKKNASNEYE